MSECLITKWLIFSPQEVVLHHMYCIYCIYTFI